MLKKVIIAKIDGVIEEKKAQVEEEVKKELDNLLKSKDTKEQD